MGKISSIFKIIVLAAILLPVIATGIRAQDPLSVNCEPYGSVTINGSPASDNMLVIAYVGDIELARAYTSGGQYSLFIGLDDPATPQREGYQAGDIINIRVNGNPASADGLR